MSASCEVTRAVDDTWAICPTLLTSIETENSRCVPRLPLVPSCYEIVESRTSFTICWGVGKFTNVGSRKRWKGRSWTFYLWLRNPAPHGLLWVRGHDLHNSVYFSPPALCPTCPRIPVEAHADWFFPSRPQLAIILLSVLACLRCVN